MALEAKDEFVVVRGKDLIDLKDHPTSHIETYHYEVRTPAYPKTVDYIRVVKVKQYTSEEIIYWDKLEWQEDQDLSCIGAILVTINEVDRGVGLVLKQIVRKSH